MKINLHNALIIALLPFFLVSLAQENTVQELNGLMEVLSSIESDLLRERSQLNDPDMAAFYYPDSDRWIAMPKEQAVELADRMIVIAAMNPSIITQLKNALGFKWYFVEAALSSPGMAAENLVVLVEAKQKAQRDATLLEIDTYLEIVREEFFNLKSERDALLTPTENEEVFTGVDCNADAWAGEWKDSSYGDMILNPSSADSLTGTYGGVEKTVEGQVISHEGRCFLQGTWGRKSNDSKGPILFVLSSPTEFTGIWGYGSNTYTFEDFDNKSHNWTGSR